MPDENPPYLKSFFPIFHQICAHYWLSVLSFFFISELTDAKEIITAVRLKGEVQMWSNEQLKWINLKEGDSMIPWSLIHIGPRSAVKIEFLSTRINSEVDKKNYTVKGQTYFRASRSSLRKLKYHSVSIGDITEKLENLEELDLPNQSFASFDLAWNRLLRILKEDETQLSIEVSKYMKNLQKQNADAELKILSPKNYQLIQTPIFPFKIKVSWQGKSNMPEYFVHLSHRTNIKQSQVKKSLLNYYWLEVTNPGVYLIQVTDKSQKVRSDTVAINVKQSIEKDRQHRPHASPNIEIVSPTDHYSFISDKNIISVPFTWKINGSHQYHEKSDIAEYEIIISDDKHQPIKTIHTFGTHIQVELVPGRYSWHVKLNNDALLLRSMTSRLTILKREQSSWQNTLRELITDPTKKNQSFDFSTFGF